MPKKKSENRIKAHDLYDLHHGNITNREIAEKLGVSEKSVSGWKSLDGWENDLSTKIKNGKSTKIKQSTKKSTKIKKKGAQPGNQNAKGKNLKNQNARKHGLYSKWLPPAINEIIKEMPEDPLDIVWCNIEMQLANILHSQKILHVEDKKEWNKRLNTLQAYSRSLADLDKMIRSYYDILDRRTETASDYQKERIKLVQAQTDKIKADSNDNEQSQLTKVDRILQEIQEDAKSKAS
ncbi:MAG: hypothetical protein HFK04_07250 [Oscillospiraceae bacterium]|nr:hypothetical protein [Oscillospiraceae bacterium]